MTGPFLIANPDHLRQVVQVVVALITKKHPCQADFAEEELDMEDMDSTELGVDTPMLVLDDDETEFELTTTADVLKYTRALEVCSWDEVGTVVVELDERP